MQFEKDKADFDAASSKAAAASSSPNKKRESETAEERAALDSEFVEKKISTKKLKKNLLEMLGAKGTGASGQIKFPNMPELTPEQLAERDRKRKLKMMKFLSPAEREAKKEEEREAKKKEQEKIGALP